MLPEPDVNALTAALDRYGVGDIAEAMANACRLRGKRATLGTHKGDPREWQRLQRAFTTIARTASV